MTIEEMRIRLQQSLKPKRYEHSVRVYETALKMAEHYHADIQKVAVAALIHDCGRQISKEYSVAKAKELGIPVDPVEEAQPILLHAKLGVYYAIYKYGVSPDDREVLDAIRYHSTGTADMTQTAKIVFLADLIEPGRDFEGVEEIREASFKNLDRGMLLSYENTIRYLLEDGLLIHPDAIAGYNQLAAETKTAQSIKEKPKKKN
ncbi:bis(5'-nucleosyl)-tetraphosphatase (symmetrical) YqeK [Succiniclasticum ruminis]|uniref:bis(5'-nucleosyl)-tetraphosphatase (symmetrical) n=1 Tax=Succiniclasticum ruminis DSM 9236 TaxID=1123323 RepID=A0A1I1XF65_9FIRM|nr:bis(5'-nucleosyl)-tetraphosphatase (symmetrical) YqeK [Succiniclasticum ruminis]SFE06007.1 putative HD superfamily hydrolase of NAD metabolism [Succiniclasticum ruminis DSM 9236]